MKKLLNIFFVFLLGFVVMSAKNQAFAADCPDSYEINNNIQREYIFGKPENSFFIELSNLAISSSYTLHQIGVAGGGSGIGAELTQASDSEGDLTFESTQDFFDPPTNYFLELSGPTIDGRCSIKPNFKVVPDSYDCKDVTIWQTNSAGEKCTYQNNNCLNYTDAINIQSTIVLKSNGSPAPAGMDVIHDIEGFGNQESGNTNASGVVTTTHRAMSAETYDLRIEKNELLGNPDICERKPAFQITGNCECKVTGEDDPDDLPDSEPDKPFSLCKQIPGGPQFDAQREECLSCTGGADLESEENRGVWTAIGCIKRDPQSIMQRLINVGLGMSGGVALLTFLAAGFIFSTSQGDPKAYGKAKEMMTASIVGIIFVIFSVTLLQFIGFEILKIPGFGG